MYELEKTKSGKLTLKYNNKYIHSKYDPIKEAEQFAKGNAGALNEKNIVLYGIGLGYHIDAMMQLIKEENKLVVFEYNSELIKYCREVNPDVFNYKNIEIVGVNEENFWTRFAESIKNSNGFLIHRPSLETISKENSLLYNLLNDFSMVRQQNEMQIDIIAESDENIKMNKECNAENIKILIDEYKKIKKDYVIAAAGPSLDNDIELLKKYREKFNVVCVGSALRTLIDNQIYPDFVVIIDPREIVKKQFENIDCTNLKLCFCASASRYAVNEFEGGKYIFNTEEKDDDIEIRTSGTVAVAAIDIAIKCNAEKIIMIGQDLAFIGDKSHTSTFEKTYGFKDEVSHLKNGKKTVKGYNGKILQTTKGYITFKNKIESIIRLNNGVEFINCSKGAYIEGAIHSDFNNECILK